MKKNFSKQLEAVIKESNPSFSIYEKHLKDIKEWEVGKEYNLKLKVKMVRKEITDYNDDKIESRFEILKVSI